MYPFLKAITVAFILAFSSASAIAQSNLTLSTDDIKINGHGTYEFLIPANIDTLIYPMLTLFVQGGDGGRVRHTALAESPVKIRGGGGANVIGSFALGFAKTKLAPGGLLRFIVGEHGENNNVSDQDSGGGGGGGGSAVLYLHPGVDESTIDNLPFTDLTTNTNIFDGSETVDLRPDGWIILLVAGGGSGATVDGRQAGVSTKLDEGESGNIGPDGGDGGPDFENAGGQDGGDGEDSPKANGGHGYLAAGLQAQARDNTYSKYGGSGYGAGGSAQDDAGGSGGGGGFSGGAAGENIVSGGGGGTKASVYAFGPLMDATNATRFPKDGHMGYRFTVDATPGDPPVTNCVDDFNVVIRGGESVTLTPEDFDNGSFDPSGFDFTLQLCQWDSEHLEYVCGDSKTWDCDDVGRRQAWYLAVDNGYQTDYCHVDIRIVEEEEAFPSCPYTEDVIVNLDDGCSQFFPPEELAPLNMSSCTEAYPHVRIWLPDNRRETPTDFFTNGYTFGAGRTNVVYTNRAGNFCFYNVVVNPSPAPLPMTCPTNRTVDIRLDCTIELGAADLMLDYDGPGTITHTIDRETMASLVEGDGQLPDQTIERGLTRFTYQVVEPGGCEGSCTFEVNGRFDNDNKPTIVCQDATYPRSDVQLNVRQAGVAGLVSAEDDCGAAPVALISDIETGCDWIGVSQEVTLEAGRGFFSRSCTYNLTLTELDYTPTCSGSRLFVTLGEDLPQELPAEDVAIWTADPRLTVTTTMPFINCDDVAANHTVTITLEDDCGNTDSCDRIVVVRDNTRPVITCQDITRSLDANGEATISYSDLVTEVTDNCGQADMTFELTQTEFTCGDLGDTEVFVEVRDRSDNLAICRPIVTIVDEIAPELTCRTSTSVELGEDGTYQMLFSDFVLNVSDNCGFGFNFNRNTLTCDDLGDEPVTITVNIRDANNNLTQCNVAVTVTNRDCPCIGADGILVVNNPENVALCSDLTVNGVNFIEGNLNLSGYTLTIENDGRMLNEDESRFVADLSGGKLVVLNANDNFQQTIDDLGLDILSGQEFSFSRVERSNLPAVIDGFESIFRVLTVEEDYNDFSNDNARFHYLGVELNGLVEDNLGLYVEQAGEWTSVPILNRNTTENWVEFELDFSQWGNVARFTLTNAAALPLDLLSFTGERRDKVNDLNWTTANEEGFSHFMVERSAGDFSAWEELGAVAGAREEIASSGSYTFTDASPLTDNYYRLKMVDLDGSFSYSHIVQLGGPASANTLRVFPNPTDGAFSVALPQLDDPLNLALYSIHGTRVRAQKIAAGTPSWPISEHLTPGVYLLVVESKAERWTQRVVVR